MRKFQVNIRLNPLELAKLDAIAESIGMNHQNVFRFLIAQAYFRGRAKAERRKKK
jgi:hypothetical protein